MKLSCAFFLLLLPLGAADPQPAKAAATSKKSAPAPLSIPAGAVETEPGTFRFTDSDGKVWLYRKTPFGVARFEDNGTRPAAPAPAVEQKEEKVRAVVKGDMVHFERPGPFGIYKWDSKKSELTEQEQKWLEQDRARDAAAASGK